MRKWKSRAIYLENIKQIKAGEADLETILSLLANAREVREKIPNDIFALRGESALARAVGACVAENLNEYLSVLGQTGRESANCFFRLCAFDSSRSSG